MQSTYDRTAQIGDVVYVGRYQHASEYPPSNWVVGQSVDARVGKHKHRIYFNDVQGKESRWSSSRIILPMRRKW